MSVCLSVWSVGGWVVQLRWRRLEARLPLVEAAVRMAALGLHVQGLSLVRTQAASQQASQ